MFVPKQKQPGSLFAFSLLYLLLVSTILVIFVAWESKSFTFFPTTSRKIHKHCDNSIDNNMGSTNDKSDAAIASSNGTESACLVLPTFPNCIPTERLGTKHDSLEAFHKAVFGTATAASCPAKNTKEYTLIVLTETLQQQQQPRRQRILLGLKNRVFGTGKYNSFGGNFLHDDETTNTGGGVKETVEACACRELEEETNLKIPREEMKASKVGIQKFTFSDNDKEMLVHFFFINLANKYYQSSWLYEIKECEEISPRWFEHFDDVPLDNMFADDSLYMTALLTRATEAVASSESETESVSCAGSPLEITGSYYFAENCEETNTILHYHMDVNIPPAAANNSKSKST